MAHDVTIRLRFTNGRWGGACAWSAELTHSERVSSKPTPNGFALRTGMRGERIDYTVKEIFNTLQGEGGQAGRAGGVLPLRGLQSVERPRSRIARRPSAPSATPISSAPTATAAGASPMPPRWPMRSRRRWAEGRDRRFVVFTGGEPLLQLDRGSHAVQRRRLRFSIAVETNGTIAVPSGIDWICVSPKADTDIRQTSGNELKLVYPQAEAPPQRFERLDFQHFFLQPMDGPDRDRNTELAIAYCLEHPRWRLSLQTHKLMGIP